MASTNSYPVISSEVNLGGPQFQANRAAWEDLLLKFERASIDSVAEGGEQYLLRHQQRGQLLGGSHTSQSGFSQSSAN